MNGAKASVRRRLAVLAGYGGILGGGQALLGLLFHSGGIRFVVALAAKRVRPGVLAGLTLYAIVLNVIALLVSGKTRVCWESCVRRTWPGRTLQNLAKCASHVVAGGLSRRELISASGWADR